MSTLFHLETVADRLFFLFGENCKIAQYLRSYANRVGTDPTLHTWNKTEWLAFNWQVHIGIRRAMLKCLDGVDQADMHYLGRVLTDLNTGRKFDIHECPPELHGPQKRSAEQAGLVSEKPPEPDHQEKKPAAKGGRTDPVCHAMAANFSTLVQKARDGAKQKKKFSLAKVLKSPGDYSNVFGPDFMASVEGGRLPCGKFFITKCGSQNCTFSHSIAKVPEKDAISGMVKRFEEKVNAFVVAEAGKD